MYPGDAPSSPVFPHSEGECAEGSTPLLLFCIAWSAGVAQSWAMALQTFKVLMVLFGGGSSSVSQSCLDRAAQSWAKRFTVSQGIRDVLAVGAGASTVGEPGLTI
eukprot:c55370_g1_i1 orf=90-404(-)